MDTQCIAMKTTVQRWGNSLAVRIPKAHALETQLTEGAPVDVGVEGGALVVRPLRRRYALGELLKGVSQSSLHGEAFDGAPRGRELW